MTSLTIILSTASLTVLLIGAWTWRLTSSRTLLLHTIFGSSALLAAAYETTVRSQPHWTFILPFFTTMLFAGRFIGLAWRSREEKELRLPARLLGAIAAVTLTATLAASCSTLKPG